MDTAIHYISGSGCLRLYIVGQSTWYIAGLTATLARLNVADYVCQTALPLENGVANLTTEGECCCCAEVLHAVAAVPFEHI